MTVAEDRQPGTAEETLAALAESLREAERTRRPIAPLTAEHPDLSVADAYRLSLIHI